jgi:hypothetical protein
MKMAPLVRAFGARPGLRSVVLVHTGQHYDVAMNERLFADLDMPASDSIFGRTLAAGLEMPVFELRSIHSKSVPRGKQSDHRVQLETRALAAHAANIDN